jgi:hypothetical protein
MFVRRSFLLSSISVLVLLGACSSGSGGDDEVPVVPEPGDLVIDGPAQVENTDGGVVVEP